MKPQELVPLRETCQRMKVAGFGQEDTLLVWYRTIDELDGESWQPCVRSGWTRIGLSIAAPMEAEIRTDLLTRYPEGDFTLGNLEGDPKAFLAEFDTGFAVLSEHNGAEAAAQLWLRVQSAKQPEQGS